MPTASAKYISPLDNPLWHSFKETLRGHHPLTLADLPKLLEQTFLSLSKKEIRSAYRKCAITWGADPFRDKPSVE